MVRTHVQQIDLTVTRFSRDYVRESNDGIVLQGHERCRVLNSRCEVPGRQALSPSLNLFSGVGAAGRID